MRAISIALGAAAILVLNGAVALAGGSWADCHRPPPAWYTAPRVTHTYSQSWGSGYSHASTHEYSAQRRYSYSSPPRRYHDPFSRW